MIPDFGGQDGAYLHVCSRAMTAARAGARDGQVGMNYARKCHQSGDNRV